MARAVVEPLPDGVDMRSNWRARAGGQATTHTQKSAAKAAARRRASPGDELVIKRTDGTVQSRTTIADLRGGNVNDRSRRGGGLLTGGRESARDALDVSVPGTGALADPDDVTTGRNAEASLFGLKLDKSQEDRTLAKLDVDAESEFL